MSAAPLLRMADIACMRGGRLLFEELSLTLSAGSAALITGPNGAGKSSMIRLAAGLLRPAAGRIERNGKVALADEALALDQRITLCAALSFWARIDGTRIDPALDAMGIAHLAPLPVHMLSTGQRKRASIARVIASEARVWLLDEPTNGLDTEGEVRLADAMSEHLRQGGGILAASHQPVGLAAAQVIELGTR